MDFAINSILEYDKNFLDLSVVEARCQPVGLIDDFLFHLISVSRDCLDVAVGLDQGTIELDLKSWFQRALIDPALFFLFFQNVDDAP